MGYYSDLHIDLQELNSHLQSQEPDFMDYAHQVMASNEYKEDTAKQERDLANSDLDEEMIDHDQGYDEYKEKRAGLFEQMGIKDSEPNLDFLTIRRK